MKRALVIPAVMVHAHLDISDPDYTQTVSKKVEKAQERARDIVEMFLYEHGFDTFLNEKVEEA